MVAVTKFAYLKELLEPKVRQGIDGLQFTTEGNERAKNILKTEYGKVSEIVNTYIENIMALPVVVGSQPLKVHEFYHKLAYNVQSLESLGKLSECWGLARSVLNKLKGIKADLVRGQTEWQTWGFPELVKALQIWKDIHPIPLNESPPPIKLPGCARVSTYNKVRHIKEAVCIVMISLISHPSVRNVCRSKTGNGS